MKPQSDKSVRSRQNFFANQVHQKSWKESMAGENEDRVRRVIESLGYAFNSDFFNQYPIGESFVLDFAFVELKTCIEVDGQDHNSKVRKQKDSKRDAYLNNNGWVVIRVKDKDFFDSYKMAFYKNLIKEVLKEREKQYQDGFLYQIDIPNYEEQDYTW